jgi:hypothetical protein
MGRIMHHARRVRGPTHQWHEVALGEVDHMVKTINRKRRWYLMLTRIIPDPANLSALDKRDVAVHLSRRPKTAHIIEILATCPRLKRISISPSTDVHLSESIRKLLAWAGVELLVTDGAWGKRHELVGGLVEI